MTWRYRNIQRLVSWGVRSLQISTSWNYFTGNTPEFLPNGCGYGKVTLAYKIYNIAETRQDKTNVYH